MIPEFDIHGVVPPVRGEDGATPHRSPYPIDMLAFCKRFGTSAPRREILRGFLALRESMRSSGLVDGFQWVNGSFVEDVERLRNVSPNDVDVVTFVCFGQISQQVIYDEHPEFFTPTSKDKFHVDHYMMRADRHADENYMRRVGYWYSMWSHQRETQRWKGFVSIALASNDVEAAEWLESMADSEDA